MKIKIINADFYARAIKQPPQTSLVLAELVYGPATTDRFKGLGIRSPSSVIHRLRKKGWVINTKLIWKKTAKHSWIIRQAEYTLLPNNAVKGDK
jgi:hypothetical protein